MISVFYDIYTKIIPLIGVFCFEDLRGTFCIIVITDLVKILNKRSRSWHFCAVIMHIWVSGVAEAFWVTYMWWLHHKCELGCNSSTLHCLISWLRRKLPVNFRHQTSYLSHVFRAVLIKSQFDIYFINIKQLNKIILYVI